MALTVIERPLGNKVLTAYTVNVFNSSSNAAFAQPVSMSNGDYIYISGYVENYNGFWIVDKSGSDVRIKKGDGVLVPFIVTAQVTVYTCFSHYWNCVHLPITYKLKSDTFPTNSVDPIVTITPYGFVGPYFAVQHSSLSGANALLELDFVSLNNGEKVVQVLDHISNTITLLDSDGSGTFTNMQKYRSNYNAVVNVYAGLNASHSWASQKPYELAATLKFIPNEDNEIFFSINDILKSFIEQRNNTVQPTLPNSLDDFVQFYISVAESYDESTGYTIGIHESSFTKDTPEPYAVNSILEFKNRYSGYLSDYVVDANLADSKFLTLFDTPTIFQNKYFDISFITNFNDTLILRKNWVDIDGNIIFTSDDTIPNYSQGLYRKQIGLDHNCSFVNNHPDVLSPLITYFDEEFTTDLGTFTQPNSGSVTDDWFWSDSIGIYAQYATRLQQTQDSSAIMQHSLGGSFPVGSKIRIRTRFSAGILDDYTLNVYGVQTIPIPQLILTVNMTSLDVEKIVDEEVTLPFGASGNPYDTLYFTIEGGMTGGNQVFVDYFRVDNVQSVVTPGYQTIDSLYLNLQIVNGSGTQLSEIKNFNLNCECSNQFIYLTWRNNLGGMDYWNFTAFSEYGTDIGETGETKTNILPLWPNSYGEMSSEIRRQTFRDSSKRIVVSSQNLTLDQKLAIEYIRSSILVEIMYSRNDKRRVIVDKDSFISYKDNDKLYTVSFSISYTDNIPSQRL